MKRILLILSILTILLLLSSCSSMYIPAVRSIPLLDKKGEFQAEVGASTNSVYANTSYAITDDIAVSLNGNLSYRNFTNFYDIFTPHIVDSDWFDSGEFAHRYGEISVGKINILSSPKIMKLEVFGGAGMGRATDYDNWYKSDYYSLFGQVNFGIKLRNIEDGLSMRLAYSGFDYTDRHYLGNNEYSTSQVNFNILHVEPMGCVRIGRGDLKVVLRGGINFAFTLNPKKEFAGHYGFDYVDGKVDCTIFHFSIGASYRLGGKK